MITEYDTSKIVLTSELKLPIKIIKDGTIHDCYRVQIKNGTDLIKKTNVYTGNINITIQHIFAYYTYISSSNYSTYGRFNITKLTGSDDIESVSLVSLTGYYKDVYTTKNLTITKLNSIVSSTARGGAWGQGTLQNIKLKIKVKFTGEDTLFEFTLALSNISNSNISWQDDKQSKIVTQSVVQYGE